MSKYFTAISLIFMISCQNAEEVEEFDQIRNWVKYINANINDFHKVDLLVVEHYVDTKSGKHSIEGSKIYRLNTINMTKYFDGDELIKIAVTFDGDRENLLSEYYFLEGGLSFVDKLKTIYHKPKWDTEFEESENSISKNRFYVKEKRVLRWINNDMSSVGKMDPLFAKYETEIISDVKLYESIN